MELGKAHNSEIIAAVAKKAGISKILAKQVYYALSTVIEEKLKEGKELRLPYIGTFYFYRKEPMRSNLTGQMILAHHQIKFRFRPDIPKYIRTMTREKLK